MITPLRRLAVGAALLSGVSALVLGLWLIPRSDLVFQVEVWRFAPPLVLVGAALIAQAQAVLHERASLR